MPSVKVWFPATLALCAAGAGALAGINPWWGLLPWVIAVAALIARGVARARPEVLRSEVGTVRETWGGRAIIMLVVSVVASSFLSRIIDGATQQISQDGERYLVVAGSVGRTAGFAFVAVAVLFALVAGLTAAKPILVNSWYSRWMLALIAWWLACTLVLRLESPDTMTWIEAAAAAAIAIGVVAAPPNRRTLLHLTHVLNLTVISMLAYGLVNFTEQLPCRADKCGIFGNLFVGYLFHENSAARLVVLLIPVAWVVPSRLYLIFTLTGAGVLVAATGSRTSYLTYGAAVLVVLLLRWTQREGRRDTVQVGRLVRAIPLGVLLASFVVFLFVPSSALTGRGAVYAALRERLEGWMLLVGPGPDTVASLQLGFQLGGEHGQAPHLLVHAGAVGLVLFAAAMSALLLGRRWTLLQASGFGLVLVASTQFATEELELSTRTVSYAVIVLSVGLLVGTLRESPGGMQVPPQGRRVSSTP